MKPVINLVKKQFGYLKVLRLDRTEKNQSYWRCLCLACENVVIIAGGNLRSGNSKRCTNCSSKKFNISIARCIEKSYSGGVTKKELTVIYKCSLRAIDTAIILAKNSKLK